MTTRQKSSAGPVTRSAASSLPHAHVEPSGASSSTRTSPSGAVLSRNAYEKPRAHTDVGDVTQAHGRPATDTKRVRHVLAMRPRLHQPSGGERRQRHRRPVPRHAHRRIGGAHHVDDALSSLAPPGQQLIGRQGARLAAEASLECRDVAHHLGHRGREPVGIFDGEHAVAVEPTEVMDLIADRPALGRRHEIPLRRSSGATSASRSACSAARSSQRPARSGAGMGTATLKPQR